MRVASINDPLYGTIHVDGIARELVDTAAFQRLGRIRQLQMASVVYRSAVHTRFEHAVGAFHLAKKAVRRLRDTGQLTGVTDEDAFLLTLAALVHDTGHFPGAHMAEEVGLADADHERAGEAWITEGEIAEILAGSGIRDAATRIAEIIRHEGSNPLRAIVAGSCDVDKIDYIARDAYHCGLDIGFNRDKLLDGYVLIENPATGEREVGIREAALAEFEKMLYAKFCLYRSVYFHPTVRSATVMMRELVVGALESGLIEMDELRMWTDEELFILLQSRVGRRRRNPDLREVVGRMIGRIQARQLYRPIVSFPLSSAPELSPAELRRAETYITEALGLDAGDALIDVPHKPSMLSTDVLVLRSDERTVVSAGDLGPDDGFALGPSAEAFYHASGRWALFVSDPSEVAPKRAAAALDEALQGVAAAA